MNGLLCRLLTLFGIKYKGNYVYQVLCIPDYFWGWIPFTISKALKLIKKHDIGVIYASCSPYSSALIGTVLKYLTGKPFVLDYRDPYTLEEPFSILKLPAIRRKIDRYFDKLFLKYADIFIVNNEDTKDAYIRQYPEVKRKIFAVHNGFDAVYSLDGKPAKYSKFTIAYTGEFYFYAPHSNHIFFEAISLLKKSGKLDQNNFQFLFYGDGKAEIERIAGDHDIEDIVIASHRIPYREVLDILARSHLQLLRIVKPMISTKLFEGIPMNVPFLATIPPGEVEEIINKYSPSSYVVSQESPEKIADAIVDAITKYKNNQIKDNKVREFLDSFSRENLTLKLINIMEQNLSARGQNAESN
jgi:glycosyltransferase involved in cell wall biosynthesis